MAKIHIETLKATFKEVGAFNIAPPGKPFKLASGKESDYYVDCRKILLYPRGIRFATYAMYDALSDFLHDIDKEKQKNIYLGATGVGGQALLGALLFYTGAFGHRAKGFVVRETQKDHGLKRSIEGHVDKDGLIIMLDDVLTTGGSMLKAAETLWQVKAAKPDALIVLVDREEGGADNIKRELGCGTWSVLKVKELAT